MPKTESHLDGLINAHDRVSVTPTHEKMGALIMLRFSVGNGFHAVPVWIDTEVDPYKTRGITSMPAGMTAWNTFYEFVPLDAEGSTTQ